PLLLRLNWSDGQDLASWLQYGKAFGNLIAVAMFFAVIALFVGAGLWAADVEGAVWMAAAFAGLLATGLAIFLFPGKPARLLMVPLRSALHLVFILSV